MHWNQQSYKSWGRTQISTAAVARPERHGTLAQTVAASDHILAIGSLRSYGDAPLAGGEKALSTARLDRFLSFDDETGVLEAEAGVRLGEILRIFAPRGWMPKVLPGTGMTTIGGAIANDVHGKNHHAVGSFAQHVISVALVTADGQTRQISPSKNAELWRATVGGVGQTGLITSAKIQLAPCNSTHMKVHEERVANLEAFIARFEEEDAPYQVGWIDALARGKSLGRGVFEAADFDHGAAKEPKPPKQKSLWFTPPGFVLSPSIVRMFNRLYRWRVPRQGRIRSRPLQGFFFPLDAITNWNIIYGKGGFHQFQCVVPVENAAQPLRKMLEAVAKAGLASPLAVLKRMGPGRAGHLSFPMEGYTLAVDIPNRKTAPDLLARLEALTAQAGGRLYLAKDGMASPAGLQGMYDELDAYRKIVADVDPDGKFRSVMAGRLGLRGTS